MTPCIKANAQLSTLKVGANFNADIASHKLGKLNYPSWEVSFERAFSKKFSYNITYNYARRHYEIYNEYNSTQYPGLYSGPKAFTIFDHAFILEARYYLKSTATGIYFHLGIPFTYSLEQRFATSPYGDNMRETSSFAISTIGGFGIKYPLSQRFGVEMDVSISPSFNFLDVDYGTSGFIKSGVKLFFLLNKN